MSAEARAYVYQYSPFKGATFTVHLAVADVANDVHRNEVWMFQAELASKTRLGRQAINENLQILCSEGFLQQLDGGGGRSRPARFRFLFPDVPVIWASNKLSSMATVNEQTVASVAETVVHDDTQRTKGTETNSLTEVITGTELVLQTPEVENQPAVASPFAAKLRAEYLRKSASEQTAKAQR